MSRDDLMTSYRSEGSAAQIGSRCRQSAHLNDVRTLWTIALAGGAQA
jgi:hypothetical protein